MSLEVGAGQCGWKKAGQKVRLELYVQYDAHVQQVVDEQITVECDMDRGEGGIVSEYYGQEVINIPVQSVQSYGLGQSWASVEEEELLESEEFGEKLKKGKEQVENDLVKRGRMDEDIGSMMGWLDITEGINQGGKSVSKPVKEGDNVIISAKVKQMAGMDTMLASGQVCHAGQGGGGDGLDR